MENRTHRLAKRLRRRALMDAGINRVVDEPLRFRKFVRDDFLQPRTGRRGAAFGEKRQAFAGVRSKLLREAVKEAQRFLARNSFAVVRKTLCAVGVVKVQDGSLRVTVGAAVAAGIKRV